MWDKRCVVNRVIDGDTLSVTLDQGFGDTKRIDLRLDKVYAPERKEVGSIETAMFVARWIQIREHGPWPFVMTTSMIRDESHEKTTFGRFVGTLTCKHESLNDAVNKFVKDNNYPKGTGG